MIDLKNISRIYFIGIGGIGMSALARYFSAKGVSVSGYDKTETALTAQLENEGMKIHYNDDESLLDKKAQLIVYTPAMSNDHKELNYYKENNYQILKRSDVLGLITENSYNICVAGTHGKTTISAMIAHILQDSNYGCNAFLGGIATNYNTNFWSSKKNVCVIEADEYDRSFLKLKPDVAIISSMDADHLNIYGTEDEMQRAFIDFSGKVKSEGLLITKYGLQRDSELKANKHWRYSLKNNAADIFASNISMSHGIYLFDVISKDWTLNNIILNMGGMHNVENAVAAISVAHHLKIDSEKIRSAIENFKGVKRRFEYIISPSDKSGIIFIDDYAHHPEELKTLVTSAKDLYPGKKCTIVFQPHLFSRTKDFATEFAAVLDNADEVILLPIYPARELPMEGVTSELILNKMKNTNKKILNKDELLNWIKSKDNELFITAGAGDIDKLVQPIKQIINTRQ